MPFFLFSDSVSGCSGFADCGVWPVVDDPEAACEVVLAGEVSTGCSSWPRHGRASAQHVPPINTTQSPYLARDFVRLGLGLGVTPSLLGGLPEPGTIKTTAPTIEPLTSRPSRVSCAPNPYRPGTAPIAGAGLLQRVTVYANLKQNCRRNAPYLVTRTPGDLESTATIHQLGCGANCQNCQSCSRSLMWCCREVSEEPYIILVLQLP